MWRTLSIALLFVLGVAGVVDAHTVTVTWTWPTTNVDGSPLKPIAGLTVFDGAIPAPGFPGTVVACPITLPIALPAATPTGTCTTGQVTSGNHGPYIITINDNSVPPQFSVPSAPSNSVVVPASGPNPVTGVTATVN